MFDTLLIDSERLVWWPAKIVVPADGGEWAEVTIQLKVKLVTADEKEAVMKEATENKSNDEEKIALYTSGEMRRQDDEWLCAHIRDWKGVVGQDGPIPFSYDMLKKACLYQDIRQGFGAAIAEASGGGAARKN